MPTAAKFEAFLGNLNLTDAQILDGTTKFIGVSNALSRSYYKKERDNKTSFFVGSWGKATQIRPPRDVDMMFVLPFEVYLRFEKRSGNKQSQLLQEVKSVLISTYSSTDISGDGQVVVVPFSSYKIEVVPAFNFNETQYWICNTHNGGSYKASAPHEEIAYIQLSNKAVGGKTVDLVKMTKRWQEYCSVPMKSFWIELLAIDFLKSWSYNDKSIVYYDWMVRDFFAFIINRANTYVVVPGISELIFIGQDWKSRAETALSRAEKACRYELDKKPFEAGEEWQKIFGIDIPRILRWLKQSQQVKNKLLEMSG